MTVKVKKIAKEDKFYHVRFRDPKLFTSIRTPDWAENIADGVLQGSEVRMGENKKGNWQVQSVLIPAEVPKESDAKRYAVRIADVIEGGEGMEQGGQTDSFSEYYGKHGHILRGEIF